MSKKIVKIVSKDKRLSPELTSEAKAVLRRRSLTEKQLLRMLLSNDVSALPDSAQVRQLALDALYLRGYKVFDEA